MEEINMEALNAALDHIVAHPEEWDQTNFAEWHGSVDGNDCGTTFCLAGRVCLQNLPIRLENDYGRVFGRNTETGDRIDWEADAYAVLNISNMLAWALFYNMGNALDDNEDLYWTSAQDFADWVRQTVHTYQQTGNIERLPVNKVPNGTS